MDIPHVKPSVHTVRVASVYCTYIQYIYNTYTYVYILCVCMLRVVVHCAIAQWFEVCLCRFNVQVRIPPRAALLFKRAVLGVVDCFFAGSFHMHCTQFGLGRLWWFNYPGLLLHSGSSVGGVLA